MRKIKAFVACVTLAGLAGIVAPPAAQAGAASAASATGLNNGYFSAYQEPYRNWSDEGTWCDWLGNDGNWADCTNTVNPDWTEDMQNHAESMYNDGIRAPYDDVNVYYDRWQSGAYACLPQGEAWEDLTTLVQRFDHYGNNGHGLNQQVNDNVASHKWVRSC